VGQSKFLNPFNDSQVNTTISPLILPDVFNQIWFLLIIFLFYYFKLVRLRLFLFLIVTAFLPFLINDIVFPATYMPDQFAYFTWAYESRYLTSVDPVSYWSAAESRHFIWDVVRPNKKHVCSLFFAYFPIPFINSVTSISIINRIIYTVLIILSVHYKIIKGNIILFFLLFPGLILYSSIALREMLVLFIMLASAYCLIYKRYLYLIPFLIFLFLIKFQNAMILGTISLFYIIICGTFSGSRFLKIPFLFLVFFLLMFLYFYFQTNLENLIYELEGLRRYFYAEECQKITGYYCWYGYEPIDLNNFYKTFLFSILDFAFAPLIWESANVFQYLQAFENIIVNLLFIILLYQLFKYNKINTIFWLSSICFAYGIYGVLIFNFGTLSRYRFPFLVTFIFIISAEINKFRFNKT